MAADERYADAEALAAAGRRTGAIYLYGYVVEMLLKVAYFRLIGFSESTPIDFAALSTAVGTKPLSQARLLGLPGVRNFHDLMAWANLIIAYRTRHGLRYHNARFARKLKATVRVISRRWTEVTRYHSNVAYTHELAAVRVACQWVRANRNEI